MYFNEQPLAEMILSRIGAIASTEIFDFTSLLSRFSCLPRILISICSNMELPCNGFNPCPSILIQPHSFNLLSTSCALIHVRIALISSSVNLFASSVLTSSKSNTSHCCDDTIALLTLDGIELTFQDDEGALKAIANIALDGLDRYSDTLAKKPLGKSEI